MNAQSRPPAPRPAMPRRVRRVADEIVRLARRSSGVGLDEVCSLTGMKEQTARSRISKLKQRGFDIVRDPSDDRYYLVPGRPKAEARPDDEPDQHDNQGDDEVQVERPTASVSSRSSQAALPALPDVRGLTRVLEIMAARRELHLVNFQGRLIFSHFNEHGVYQMEHVDLDVAQTLEVLRNRG